MDETASLDNLLHTVASISSEIAAAKIDTPAAAEAFRIEFLGQKRGAITRLFKQIPSLPRESRKPAGIALNRLRKQAKNLLTSANNNFTAAPSVARNHIDLTLPGRRQRDYGSLHPITHALRSITAIFERMGFSTAEGPEIEDDWHNFTALNFPADHPARDMQDTLFVKASESGAGGVMLRTHTSPVQIRSMLASDPPFRLIAPGRVYRNEAITFKSYCLFHQVEGLVVDEGVTMAHLKHILVSFCKALFGEDVKLRFRPSYFPFTEPSAELDIWWERDGGGRWMEILGSGMVHPNVLDAVGIDSERYTGYAFGMGVERPAMMLYNIGDIRLFYENDSRLLAQF